MYNVSCCFPLTTEPSPYYTVFVHSFVHIYMYFHRYDNVTLSPLLLQHLLVFRDCLYSRWFFFNIFRSFLLTHGMLFRDLISLFGLLLFMFLENIPKLMYIFSILLLLFYYFI